MIKKAFTLKSFCLKLLFLSLIPGISLHLMKPAFICDENPSFYQIEAMAKRERVCMKEDLCFNANGNINHAQSSQRSTYQLGFGRWSGHFRDSFNFIHFDDERWLD